MTRRALLPVSLALGILAASLLPLGSAAGAAPRGLDKLVHALGYGALAAAWLWARPRSDWTEVGLVVAGVVAVGGAVELLQLAVPSRTTSAVDALANAVGALLVGAVWSAVDAGRTEARRSTEAD